MRLLLAMLMLRPDADYAIAAYADIEHTNGENIALN